jgi:hypothetical protein
VAKARGRRERDTSPGAVTSTETDSVVRKLCTMYFVELINHPPTQPIRVVCPSSMTTAAASRLGPAAARPALFEADTLSANTSTVGLFPLALLEKQAPTLLFLKVEDDALLFSKLPNVSRKQCTRVLGLKKLRCVRQLSKHAFEIVCIGAPPVRLEAHDAFVSDAS